MLSTIKFNKIKEEVIARHASACSECKHNVEFIFKIGNCLIVTPDNVSVRVHCRAVKDNAEGVIRTPKNIRSNEECLHFQRHKKRRQEHRKKIFS